jgi:hypothetical protein
MGCRCNEVPELYGDAAEQYAGEHLHREETRTEAMEERYSCPDTGSEWLLDYPDRTEREPGQARLRKVQ